MELLPRSGDQPVLRDPRLIGACPFLVVAGVIVHADNTRRSVENCLRRTLPLEHHDTYIFSAKHLFNGDHKIFKRNDPDWPLERRLKIADDLAAIPKKCGLPVVLGFVDRAKFPSSFDFPEGYPEGEKTVAAHVCAFMNCAMAVEHWMRQNASNEICMLIVENNDRAKALIQDVHRYHQNKKISELLDEDSKKHFPFRKIKEDPLFQPKRQSSPLLVADFCAYVWKKFLMGNRRFDRFYEPFRKQIFYF